MTPIRIDFMIHALHGGGAERVMVLLANHFAGIGHSVNLITFNKSKAYELNQKVEEIQLYHRGYIKNHKLRSFLNLMVYYHNHNRRPDVLISFIPLNNLIAVLVGKLYGVKTILSEHNNHLQSQNPKWLTSFTRNYVYRFANKVTVLTAYDLDFFKSKGANVMVMPNPCTFQAIDSQPSLRQKALIAVGNLDRFHHKGFDNLIRIMGPILLEYPEWKLRILGGGTKGLDYLTKLANKEGILDRIDFLGFQNNIQEFMKDSEIFILSSRYEGLPMVLLEAMSQGMTCVAYDCITGPSEIIEHDINGLLVKNQDQNAMSETVKNVIKNESLRKRLQKEAPIRVASFGIDVIGKKWDTLFKEIGV